uniref:Sushi domain-containing protein n=1 Tax=Branchiostoma floridae TaxID=7739 RepID=C3Y9N2_BRAFL|eukprot:XP_002607278.1 hypothetical protein BRAFLDRAFT_125175 [Branchiostoma floridae]
MRPTRTSSQILPRIDDCECTPSIQHLFRRHYLLQSPMYYIRWLYAVIYSLYLLFVLRSRDPTDTDIVGYIENTTMAILVRPATDGKLGEYEVTFCDCKLRTSGGYKLKNMLLRYKTGKNGVHILRFIRNGVEVTDRSQIFSTIYFYHIHSMHTKSHLFSNSLVRNIVNNDVKTLQESSYTSIPLHYQLLHSSLSVLEWDGNMSRYLGYGDACIRESIVEESRNMSALEGHQAVHRWNSHGKDSFAGKLFRVRAGAVRSGDVLALQDVMERHGIDPKMLDALFNHTIVHSVDHHGISERSFLRFSLHPCTWDKDCSTYRAFNTSVFRVLITQPNLNPLAPNTLRFINKPFYQDLYRELKNIDPQMAESGAWWRRRRRRRSVSTAGCSKPRILGYTYRSGCYSPYTNGERCTYRCRTGYSRVSGDYTRTCSGGRWVGTNLVCRRVGADCRSSPPFVPNTIRSGCAAPYKHLETCRYQCRRGYSRVTGSTYKRCQNGGWSGSDLICRYTATLPCSAPPIRTWSFRYGCYPPYTHGERCSFACRNGSPQSGSSTRTCNNGVWSGTPLTCVRRGSFDPADSDTTAKECFCIHKTCAAFKEICDQPHTNVAFLKVHKCGSTTVANLMFRFGDKHNLIVALPPKRDRPTIGRLGTIKDSDYKHPPGGKRWNIFAHHAMYDRTRFHQLMAPDTRNSSYGSSWNAKSMICTGYSSGGANACQEESFLSGSPLVTFPSEGPPYIVGLISRGTGCARPGKPGMSTRVSTYLDWIRDTIDEA